MPSHVEKTAETILVTGGAGYIGSHTMLELLAAGFGVVCLDNFSNSAPEAIRRCEALAGRTIHLVEGDVRDPAALARAFDVAPIAAVVHFAALKAVGESVTRPLDYYDNNVSGTLALLRACRKAAVTRFIFSSSATVYGVPETLPLTEEAPLSTTSPYGATKLMVEQILRDTCIAAPEFRVVALRYFNPIGAHSSGKIGEDPRDIPNNLFPFVNQVAVGRRERLSIFGGDWPTADGTGIRDYIHVVDIARGHLRALQYSQIHPGFMPVNLGTGRGTSVLDLVRAVERASGCKIPYSIVGRRAGDIAACWADAGRARELLGWEAEYTLDQMCSDGWRWQQGNPDGYRSPGSVSKSG